jgi:magnesium transporter
MTEHLAHSDQPVTAVARKDFSVLRPDLTVQEALDAIRRRELGERIVYFYIVDADDRLVGVVPTRRLLTADLRETIANVMVRRVVTIPHTASVFEALEFFALYKFLAFPVVDEQEHIVGVVDVNMFTDEIFDITERQQTDEIFEILGFRTAQTRHASPLRAFRFRFPWLLATISSGLICAVLAGAFETTLAQSIVLTFFITLILGLGESVSTQAMAVTIQALRAARPTLSWYLRTLGRELKTALLLGLACGGTVALAAALWRREGGPALVIGGSILLSLGSACVIGMSVPTVLHALRLDPKVAAGPLTLALADIFTLLFYFTLATLVL